MKSKKSFDKLRGGYYTPQAITEFICKWIINKNTKNILEPSCGDGNFLKAIVERQEKLNLNLDITGVELCLDEAKKAMKQVLTEIQDGTFAKNWILENQVGRTTFNAARAAHAETLAAKTGRDLRAKMGWKQAQNLDEAK